MSGPCRRIPGPTLVYAPRSFYVTLMGRGFLCPTVRSRGPKWTTSVHLGHDARDCLRLDHAEAGAEHDI
jgi:hypothetical protein